MDIHKPFPTFDQWVGVEPTEDNQWFIEAGPQLAPKDRGNAAQAEAFA